MYQLQGHENCGLTILEKCGDEIMSIANQDQKMLVLLLSTYE